MLEFQGIYNNLLQSDLFLTQRVAYVSAGNGVGQPEYVAYAQPGSTTDGAVWAIKKLTYDSSHRVTSITWADGDNEMDNIYDNRASLSYS